MENLNNYTGEDLQKCPFHQQLAAENDSQPRENANNGDWDHERGAAGNEPHREDSEKFEEGGNDNSGGAGSTGSAATNS